MGTDIVRTGIVLAAGRGTRFDPSGQHNKLLITLVHGNSVLRSSCLALMSHVDELVVVLREPCPRIEAELRTLQLRYVYCEQADQGLGYSLACGIQHTHPQQAWVVSLGDLPFVQSTTYSILLANHATYGGIVRPSYQQQIGHPVVFSASLADELAQVRYADGPKHIFKKYADQSRVLAVSDAGVCADIDYPRHRYRCPY
ncbi:NTP transferase domain-containing protein [Paenalcaligenes hominis]|uniref:nucleotidyltransferase family protein n=1 Tax=Paenalcaligenes hominis TaxID=643674 RepID=UPI0035252F32